MRRFAATLLLCAWVAPLQAADPPPASAAQKKLLGQPRPAFALPDRNGVMRPVSQWNNQVVVLNFWASWCTPCRTEIPLLNALQTEFNPRGVQIIGIAVDTAEAVQQFARVIPMNYPVLVGGADAIALVARYGNTAGALPYTVFITRDGTIDALASGALTADYAHHRIEKLLGAARARAE